jgi:hypothetical protein
LEHVLNEAAGDGSTYLEETVAYMSVLKLIGQEMIQLYARETDMEGEGAGILSAQQVKLIRVVEPPVDETLQTHLRFRIVRIKGKPLPFYALAKYVVSEEKIAVKLGRMLLHGDDEV